jgi:hypothetical protein
MRAEGKSWVEIAYEFRGRYGVNARVAIRLAHGWSQADVAREWCTRWPDDPRSDQNLSSWERWPESGHAPSLGTLMRLAEVYQCDLSHLVADLGCYSHMDEVHARATARSNPARSRRREVAILPALSDLPGSPSREAPTDITAIQAMSDAFRAADRRLGGGLLYGSVIRYLNVEVAPLLLTPTSSSPDTELFAAAASLTEAAGWMAHDGGQDPVARLHFTRAFKLASVANNDPMRANVCASMSHLASQLGEHHEAVRLADMGLQHADQRPVATQLVARLHAMRALGLAGQRETRGCLRALDRAEGALRTFRAQDVGWVSHFDEGSLAIETATCLRHVGDPPEAERHVRRAIELRGGDRVRSRTLAQIILAQVLVDTDRVDEAASIGTDVCEAAGALTSTRVIHQLDSLRSVLTEHSALAAVAEFFGALAELRRPDPLSDQTAPWPN